MPHYILIERRIVICMDVGLTDTYAVIPRSNKTHYYFKTRGRSVNCNINCTASSMSTLTASALRLLPSNRTISAVKFERDTSKVPGPVKPIHGFLVHVL